MIVYMVDENSKVKYSLEKTSLRTALLGYCSIHETSEEIYNESVDDNNLSIIKVNKA